MHGQNEVVTTLTLTHLLELDVDADTFAVQKTEILDVHVRIHDFDHRVRRDVAANSAGFAAARKKGVVDNHVFGQFLRITGKPVIGIIRKLTGGTHLPDVTFLGLHRVEAQDQTEK